MCSKAEKSGHTIAFSEDMCFIEQIDRPLVEGMMKEQIAAWQGDGCEEESRRSTCISEG